MAVAVIGHKNLFPRIAVRIFAQRIGCLLYTSSGNQVSFEGGSGDCSQIIMKNGSVPMSVIPAKVKTYAGNTYPGQRIVMMETTADGYKVALSDKTVLDFDKDGNFTKATK